MSLATEASGVVLFVHAGDIQKPNRITMANRLVEEVRREGEGTGVDGGAEGTEVDPWAPKKAPTQVKVVELLQFVAACQVGLPNTRKLAIVISAWDLVKGEGRSPDEWLTRHLPLLRQYIHTNPELWTPRVYGVSAQGGERSDPERLLRHGAHSSRIIITGPEVNENDITAPVRWLMRA